MNHFSSKDFATVPSVLSPQICQPLIHKQVKQNPIEALNKLAVERAHPISVVNLPSRTISVTIGGIVKSGNTRKHRHNYETIIYILKGIGKSIVEEREIQWQAGDAIYIPVWTWHQHFNLSDTEECEYIGCENAPLLKNLGDIALREES